MAEGTVCSACMKTKEQVKNLICLPGKGSYAQTRINNSYEICNECVELLVEMIAEEDAAKGESNGTPAD